MIKQFVIFCTRQVLVARDILESGERETVILAPNLKDKHCCCFLQCIDIESKRTPESLKMFLEKIIKY